LIFFAVIFSIFSAVFILSGFDPTEKIDTDWLLVSGESTFWAIAFAVIF
jgi:hypothetical protein